ncbi:MAG: uncharacterized protein KVP18_002443 [Porospora cf. gigantea A]|uniref:uncharacterized protein n=1 Tax=Porospora cf. gigantea A TaxID=2853593 RepID=UPI003559E2D8|nr:MAG: hypothetical protein KVP18_002443 [Porospora cf. gigantea A]
MCEVDGNGDGLQENTFAAAIWTSDQMALALGHVKIIRDETRAVERRHQFVDWMAGLNQAEGGLCDKCGAAPAHVNGRLGKGRVHVVFSRNGDAFTDGA